MNVEDNFKAIQHKIQEACQRVNRIQDEVTIIAVTKYVSIERAQQAIAAGVHNLGENRLEGFLTKFESIANQANWHFIGTLQSRKVKDLIDNVSYIHSLDRKSLAKEINKRANRKVPCFVQVNVSGEDSKHGLPPEEVVSFVENLSSYANIEVVGLMTMAPHSEDQSYVRAIFSELRNVKEEIEAKKWGHAPCHYLSMGMSNDFEIAIEEGATHIRIGSKLVGHEYD
ncbi:YggS family pyridoxal phosphate-dependent enzyme [Pontibacillus yanchengensis]|uniref:YggS family pyridoxal phosphate-dependent enzyme n=1 Tax=Pontibacillus yanchengensis TaxID=462910 RepID=UPI00301C9243